MSEESILTKDETINQPITNTATDTGTAVNTADASNIVPFASESTSVQTEDMAAPKTPEVQLTTAEVPETPQAAPAAAPGVAPGVDAVTAPASAKTPDAHNESAAFSGNTVEYNDKTADITDKTDAYTDRTAGFTGKTADFTDKAADFTDKAANFTSKTFKKAVSHVRQTSDDEFPEDDVPEKRRFHFKKEDKEFFRDKWILSRISDENLMDYLTLEQRRNELQQEAKDIKEKRIFKAFETTVGLASIVAVIYLLRDNPTILVNILYIAGILAVLWFWKNPRGK